MKFEKNCRDGLTMDADTSLIFLDNDQHFLDNRWGDLCRREGTLQHSADS